MKSTLLLLAVLFILQNSDSQSLPGSVMLQYNQAHTSSIKGKVLLKFIRRDMPGTTTQKISVLLDQADYFKETEDETGIQYINLGIGILSWRSGEYVIATKFLIPVLKYFETVKDTTGILRSLDAIGTAFVNSQNYEEGLAYWKRALPIAKQYRDTEIYGAILNNTSDCYLRMSLSDSALYYIQEAVAVDREAKDTSNLSYAVGTMGEIYMLRNEHDIARPFLNQSVLYSKMKNDGFGVAYSLKSIAESFFATATFDSSIAYAQQSLFYAQPDYKNIMMSSYEWLYKNYEKKNLKDSVYKYYRLAMSTKDSLFTIEKSRNLQSANFQELVRLREKEIEKEKAESDRIHTIQFVLIALGIISFIILFLLLSQGIITNIKLIKLLGVVALLMVFEFFNLLLHPFLERVTNHSLILMLLGLVCIAAILVPLHHKLEKWTTTKLVQKNKQIRLAAAKRTIEKLEDSRNNQQ